MAAELRFAGRSGYHAGEQAVHRLVTPNGVGPYGNVELMGQYMLLDGELSHDHLALFERVMFVVAATVAAASGDVVASVLCGVPGTLVTATDPTTLLLTISPPRSDPLRANLWLDHYTQPQHQHHANASASVVSATKGPGIGAYVGLLTPIPHLRARFRVNGRVTAIRRLATAAAAQPTAAGTATATTASASASASAAATAAAAVADTWEVEIAIDQAFGNCPKYIAARTTHLPSDWQQRVAVASAATAARRAAAAAAGDDDSVRDDLSAADRLLISTADTLYLATAHADARAATMSGQYGTASGPGTAGSTSASAATPASAAVGLDASHRGGLPGFVRVLSATELVWGDYAGNHMFNSFGNLHTTPHAGLLFVDFARRVTLQLTGTAHVLFDKALVNAYGPFAGAAPQRLVKFTVTQRIRSPVDAVPLHWTFVSHSPYNVGSAAAGAGAGSAAVQADAQRGRASAVAPLVRATCVSVRDDGTDVQTFVLALARPVVVLPGQYGIFQFDAPPHGPARVIRTWTIADARLRNANAAAVATGTAFQAVATDAGAFCHRADPTTPKPIAPSGAARSVCELPSAAVSRTPMAVDDATGDGNPAAAMATVGAAAAAATTPVTTPLWNSLANEIEITVKRRRANVTATSAATAAATATAAAAATATAAAPTGSDSDGSDDDAEHDQEQEQEQADVSVSAWLHDRSRFRVGDALWLSAVSGLFSPFEAAVVPAGKTTTAAAAATATATGPADDAVRPMTWTKALLAATPVQATAQTGAATGASAAGAAVAGRDGVVKLLLVSGGVGITPMAAIVRALQRRATDDPRAGGTGTSSSGGVRAVEVRHVHGDRTRHSMPFRDELVRLAHATATATATAATAGSGFEFRYSLTVAYSSAQQQQSAAAAPPSSLSASCSSAVSATGDGGSGGGGGGGGACEVVGGRVDASVLARVVSGAELARGDWHVFYCGPPPFMAAVRGALARANCPAANMHSEEFTF